MLGRISRCHLISMISSLKTPRPPKTKNDNMQHDRYREEKDNSNYLGDANTLHKGDDFAHEEEPKEKEMAGGYEMDN